MVAGRDDGQAGVVGGRVVVRAQPRRAGRAASRPSTPDVGDVADDRAQRPVFDRVAPVGEQRDPQPAQPGPHLRDEREHVVEVRPRRRRAPVGGAADDRPVGDRVGERHGQLEAVDAALVEHRHEVGQHRQRRVAGVEEQREPEPPGSRRRVKNSAMRHRPRRTRRAAPARHAHQVHQVAGHPGAHGVLGIGDGRRPVGGPPGGDGQRGGVEADRLRRDRARLARTRCRGTAPRRRRRRPAPGRSACPCRRSCLPRGSRSSLDVAGVDHVVGEAEQLVGADVVGAQPDRAGPRRSRRAVASRASGAAPDTPVTCAATGSAGEERARSC